MLPKLIEISLPFGIKVPIYSYGLLMLAGFLAAYLLASRLARGTNIKNSDIFDAGFVAIIAGLIGAKISYFLHSPDYFAFFISDPIGNIGYLSGGLDFFGGLIAAIPSVFLFLRAKGYEPIAFGDMIAPAIAIGHAFGRLGCFMNGCCYGVRCESCGLEFAQGSAVWYDQIADGIIGSYAIRSAAVFPSQLMELSLLVILAIVLTIMFRRRRFAGQNLAIYLASYGVIRFAVQFTRADEAIQIGPLTIWHVVALGVMTAGVVTYLVWRKRAKDPCAFRRSKPVEEVKCEPPASS
jgi:phosphatidylglycerol:prolipoprotein diacylglycerol transferase